MSPDDLIALNEQIAGMARAGLPLDRGLRALAQDMAGGRLKKLTDALVADLEAGTPLPDALARRRDVPPYYAGLVTAGVRTGRLPDVLATLTRYARTVADARRTVIDALFYPAILLVIGIALTVLMVLVVLPQFDDVYRDFGMQVPPVTQAVLTIGRNPISYIIAPLGIVLAIRVIVWAVLRLTPRGRQAWARAVYAVPIIGTLIRSARLAAFADLLGILVEYETPLPEAFRLAGSAAADPVIGDAARRAADRLEAGTPLGQALDGQGLVPAWVAWLASTGERHGRLAAALHEVAAVYRRQADGRAAFLRTVLPPAVVFVVAGGLVTVFVACLMLPLVKLLNHLAT